MPIKKTYDEVKRIIEEKGSQLVSAEYVNGITPLEIKLNCGHEVKMTLDNFIYRNKKGKNKCRNCNISVIINIDKNKKFLESFIKNSKDIHGDLYNYEKVIYKGCDKKVIIKCNDHGDFEQTPTLHLKGSGCPKCANILRNINNKKSTDIFIQQAKLVHNNKYDYSKVNYNTSKIKVIIICSIHGEFEQLPNVHLHGSGCQQCNSDKLSKIFLLTTEQFIEKAISKHGDKYDYTKVKYIKSNKELTIICKIHGDFKQIANSHLQGHGCPYCGNVIKKTNEEFILEAKQIHGDLYDYSKTIYISSFNKVKIICKIHGEFEQIARSHIIGRGCILCGYVCSGLKSRKTIEQFIMEANNVHENKYDYSRVIYINSVTNIKILCLKHGEFETTPYNHINGRGCLKCIKSQYSKKAIRWLNYIALKNNLYIQHAENEGEYKIGRYKVDGYCKENNTCYEFQGDYFHGNPNIFSLNDYNKLLKCTFGELLIKTYEKIITLTKLGYNVVMIWENDWDRVEKENKKLIV